MQLQLQQGGALERLLLKGKSRLALRCVHGVHHYDRLTAALGMQVCEDAAAAGRASERLLLEWPRLALRFGRAKAALGAAARGTQQASASAELWRQRLVLESQHASFQVRLSPPCENL